MKEPLINPSLRGNHLDLQSKIPSYVKALSLKMLHSFDYAKSFEPSYFTEPQQSDLKNEIPPISGSVWNRRLQFNVHCMQSYLKCRPQSEAQTLSSNI